MWQELYEKAKKVLKEDGSLLGSYVCVILSNLGNVYVARSAKSLEIKESAVKWCLLKMIENEDYELDKLVLINELEEIIIPSFDEIIYLQDFNKKNKKIEILLNIDDDSCVDLNSILPEWWGTCRLK